MEQIDMKKLETAIIYIQRIADGKNPINNMPADDDAVMNDPNVVRCMFFVKEVLEEVKRSGGIIYSKKKKAVSKDYSYEALKSFKYIEDKPISRLVEQMNENVDLNLFRRFTYKPIQDWLLGEGYLELEYVKELDKYYKTPTDKGVQFGIRAERRRNTRGIEYISSIYNKDAQEFIVNNIENIIYYCR